jgi:hypothetical protein
MNFALKQQILLLLAPKGQLILEDFLLYSNTPKNQQNILQISALASKKRLNQKIKVPLLYYLRAV